MKNPVIMAHSVITEGVAEDFSKQKSSSLRSSKLLMREVSQMMTIQRNPEAKAAFSGDLSALDLKGYLIARYLSAAMVVMTPMLIKRFMK